MRILYAVQATGNGHLARAVQVVPVLSEWAQVDVFMSGSNAQIQTNLPVVRRSKGLSFQYNHHGGISIPQTVRKLDVARVWKEIRQFDFSGYDLLINDFECISAYAARLQKFPSVAMSHQASFLSKHTPRPLKKEWLGESVLKHYAPAGQKIGFHFKPYDQFILPPVIRTAIRQGQSYSGKWITVYLPAYGVKEIATYLHQFGNSHFQVFTGQVSGKEVLGNCTFFPASLQGFTESLLGCRGVFCNAGFETPAEALFLGKPLMVMPILGQYEQLCNAAALKLIGIPVVDRLNDKSALFIQQWLENPSVIQQYYPDFSPGMAKHIIERAGKANTEYQFADFWETDAQMHSV